jgi:hypothetical protein
MVKIVLNANQIGTAPDVSFIVIPKQITTMTIRSWDVMVEEPVQ